jgi:uncharacterized protein (TIGR03437 family)
LQLQEIEGDCGWFDILAGRQRGTDVAWTWDNVGCRMCAMTRPVWPLLFLALKLSAQQYVVSTLAGGSPPLTPAPAPKSAIGSPNSVATDAAGNFYFSAGQCVFKVDSNLVLTVVAGNSRRGYSGDGGPAVNAELYSPEGVTLDQAGNLFIADEGNNVVRKVAATGIITTVAGIGIPGFSGDGGSATESQLNAPFGVALDAAGNLYVSDWVNNRVRKVSTAGIITTIGGNGIRSSSGDGGPAIAASIGGPFGIAVDASGNIFVADQSGDRVRMISASGIISTVAGNGTEGYSGDGGVATDAELVQPFGVAVDSAGNLYIADRESGRIREVSSAGIIITIASTTFFSAPTGVARDAFGNVYVADSGANLILKVSGANVLQVAGNGATQFSGDGGPAASAQMNELAGLALDQAGNLYVADFLNGRVREISTAGIITTVAGAGPGGAVPGDGGPATKARLVYPEGLAFDSAGNLYIADSYDSRVRKVSPGGTITTVAGNGTQGFFGDGGPATSAQLANPCGVAVDAQGNLYIVDSGNYRIREVSPSGTITTVAGGGTSLVDGVPAIQEQIAPLGVAVDSSGTLYIAGAGVRKVSNGIISTLDLVRTEGIAVDASDNLYVTEFDAVQKITPGDVVGVIAGTGTIGNSGDGGPALNAQFDIGDDPQPSGIAVDGYGRVYVADSLNYSVRLLQPVNLPVIISAVIDAASQSAGPVAPGKIVVLYGTGLGPSRPVSNQPVNGLVATNVGAITVVFNGIPAPILYASSTQTIVIVPYEITGPTAQVVAVYEGQLSAAFTVPVAASAPSLFSSNETGAGEAAAINVVDGTINSAANPVKIGAYIEIFATGEGQTNPVGVDGKVGGSIATHPIANVTATVGGIPATVQYAGGVFGGVAGLMQVNVLIPAGVQPGGYVPVVLQVGTASSNLGTWIAVAGN